MQVIVLADGDVSPRARIDASWPGWADADAVVIAADGGVRHAGALGLRIDLWVGDADSVEPDQLAALEMSGVEIRRAPVAKDESDTELAIIAAAAFGADRIAILGAFGGARIDHTLANIGLLAHPALAGRTVVLLDADARITRLVAPDARGGPVRAGLIGRAGDLVSLLPVGDGVAGVTTDGLAYPLHDEPLPAGPARGLSNVRIGTEAAITVRSGVLLIVESPATLRS